MEKEVEDRTVYLTDERGRFTGYGTTLHFMGVQCIIGPPKGIEVRDSYKKTRFYIKIPILIPFGHVFS